MGFFIFINVINLLHVKLFGEMEFWLAIIKVVAIIAMIAFGSYLLASVVVIASLAYKIYGSSVASSPMVLQV